MKNFFSFVIFIYNEKDLIVYKLFSLSINISKLEGVTISAASREIQSQIEAGINEC